MDASQVKNIAFLARISVVDDELSTVAKDMDNIIALIDRVQKVQVGDISEALDKENIYRDDVVAPLESAHDLVEAAPLHKDHFVQVAKVIE
jgi:aspartyl-tRNA(Asn)/glutamyl-tRNA(Gln) amidotransferase subunit C